MLQKKAEDRINFANLLRVHFKMESIADNWDDAL